MQNFILLLYFTFINVSKPVNHHPRVEGFRFTPINSPVSKSLSDVGFADDKIGYICGDGGVILKTTDGGIKWTVLNTGSTGSFHCLFVVNAKIVCAGGFNGAFIKTNDGGDSWTNITSPSSMPGNHIWGIHFFDADNGIVLQGVDALSTYQTNNGGASWSATELKNLGGLPGTSICFLNDRTGFLTTGDPGTLLKTADGGKTWSTRITAVSQGITSVSFIDQKNGFVSDHNGGIRKTIDAGETWTTLITGISTPIRKVRFANTKNGIAVGDDGTVISTADGGNSWRKEDLGLSGFVEGVCFVNEKLGFIAADDGKIIRISLQ